LNENGPTCRCGNQGCWEVYASNTAAVRYYNEFAEAARATGKKPQPAKITSFEELWQLAEQEDGIAIQAFEKMAHYLGRGAAMLASGLSPEVIVFVGGVTRQWRRIAPVITQVVNQRASTHPHIKIVPCDSATQPRVRGIIALVLQKHFGAPLVA